MFALKKDRLAVVAFIYTACSEVSGCPLSQAVLQHVDHVLAEDPELARQVVLVSASFDAQWIYYSFWVFTESSEWKVKRLVSGSRIAQGLSVSSEAENLA